MNQRLAVRSEWNLPCQSGWHPWGESAWSSTCRGRFEKNLPETTTASLTPWKSMVGRWRLSGNLGQFGPSFRGKNVVSFRECNTLFQRAYDNPRNWESVLNHPRCHEIQHLIPIKFGNSRTEDGPLKKNLLGWFLGLGSKTSRTTYLVVYGASCSVKEPSHLLWGFPASKPTRNHLSGLAGGFLF